MNIRETFAFQARACADLGSPFTAMVLRSACDLLTPDNAIGQLVLNWPGDPSTRADSVPLRLSGALHALVLSGQNDDLKAVYPPHTCTDADLRNAIKTAFDTNTAYILDWLQSPPQTNESARAAPLVAAAHLLADRFKLPLRLLELGTSAGLNLYWDHVAVSPDDRYLGPQDAGLVLRPDWQGKLPKTANLEITSRAGVDLNPLDVSRAQDRLRLMSYIWPDQPDRLKRMGQAIDLATKIPANIHKGDAIDWLESELSQPHHSTLTTIFHTVAWQYFPKAQQNKGKFLIQTAGKKATSQTPLAWLSMENDNTPPGALLTLRLWPGDYTIPLGRADFHGRWVQWDAGTNLNISN